MRETTLVLLPGLDGTDVFFRPLIAALPKSVRVVAVCYPNTGAGTTRYADALAVVREAVAHLQEFYVLGWSYAGPLALMLAADAPERVRGVILSATFVRPPRRLLVRARFLLVGPVIWVYRATRRLPLLFRRRHDAWRRAKSETWTRVTARAVAGRMRAAMSVDVRSVLASCPQPMLYLVSSQDDVIPQRNVDDIVRVRPSIEVITIPGRHLAMFTNPDAAAGAILQFIADSERAMSESDAHDAHAPAAAPAAARAEMPSLR